MRRFSSQRLVACICLLAFGLNTVVFARGFVRCTDVNGSTRMEWGCDKDDAGHCLVVCDGSTEDGESTEHSPVEPCEDTPANNIVIATDRTVTVKSFTFPPLMPVAVLQCVHTVVPVTPKIPFLRGPTIAASPPSLLMIRTVVLLV